jgi:hypothetical protein
MVHVRVLIPLHFCSLEKKILLKFSKEWMFNWVLSYSLETSVWCIWYHDKDQQYTIWSWDDLYKQSVYVVHIFKNKRSLKLQIPQYVVVSCNVLEANVLVGSIGGNIYTWGNGEMVSEQLQQTSYLDLTG